MPTAAKKNLHDADQAAKIKKLQGISSGSHYLSSSLTNLLLWTAENDALRKAASKKENVKEGDKIPRPAKGVAGNGFRLQTAMLLQDNKPLYAALRVSPCLFCSSFPHHSQRCVRDLGDMAGLDCSVTWPRQPKEKISKIIAAVSSFCLISANLY